MHQGLKKTPFCQKREMFVKLKFCFDHSDCGLDGLCEPWLRVWSANLFQNYDTIYVRFFPTYTCNHSCYTIYVRFFVTYTCVLSCFVGTNAHIYAHKQAPYICVTNKHVVYGVTESRRIRVIELYLQQKTSLCTMELKGNFGLNQSWLQWPR